MELCMQLASHSFTTVKVIIQLTCITAAGCNAAGFQPGEDPPNIPSSTASISCKVLVIGVEAKHSPHERFLCLLRCNSNNNNKNKNKNNKNNKNYATERVLDRPGLWIALAYFHL